MAASGANVVGHVAIENVNQLVDQRDAVVVVFVGRVAVGVINGPGGTITAGIVDTELEALSLGYEAGTTGGFPGGNAAALGGLVELSPDVVPEDLELSSSLGSIARVAGGIEDWEVPGFDVDAFVLTTPEDDVLNARCRPIAATTLEESVESDRDAVLDVEGLDVQIDGGPPEVGEELRSVIESCTRRPTLRYEATPRRTYLIASILGIVCNRISITERLKVVIIWIAASICLTWFPTTPAPYGERNTHSHRTTWSPLSRYHSFQAQGSERCWGREQVLGIPMSLGQHRYLTLMTELDCSIAAGAEPPPAVYIFTCGRVILDYEGHCPCKAEVDGESPEEVRYLEWGARNENDGSILIQRQAKNTTIPAPVVATVSQYWEGNDGPWSSFAVQVGNKGQNVRLLPSTASSSTWVVYSEGCPADAPSNCQDSRGGTFNPNNSLTWVPNSLFNLGLEENLGFDVYGDFGFDSVTLGWTGSGGPTVEHSVVAGIGDTAFSWLGVLGLNPRPTNFSTFPNNPQVSFVQALRNQNGIPSVSWAYTVGAPYRLSKVFGSLVLGGYDKSRFSIPSASSSNLTFPFYTDIARDLLVGVSSITTSNTTSSSSSSNLSDNGFFAFIDSTVPHFYLPRSVCDKFEDAFGLTWNSTLQQYILSSSQHDTLTKLNPTVIFTLSPEIPTQSNTVDIALPYSAFSLNLSWPHIKDEDGFGSTTYYFPLRRATNDTQYTLGRAFLQEAYLIADYERNNFSVWPCKWDGDTNNANIVTILSLKDSSNLNQPSGPSSNGGGNNGGGGKKGLGTGAIAGIAVGVALGIIGILVAAFLYLRRRRQRVVDAFELAAGPEETDPNGHGAYPQKEPLPEEIDGTLRHELSNQHRFGVLEADQDAERKIEMEDTGVPAESGGQEIQIYEMEAGLSGVPHLVLEPPTAIEPGPDSRPSSSAFEDTLVAVSPPDETENEKRLGHGFEDEKQEKN
ncbi:aspartic peptidase domain-containing protein [Lophiotrema nucula]|uniref:Aspartic peptidase domain-containing protein n=1 Tax=Lophiotrema nucula TaxID=690887 RepID=A0A6A5Z0V1_9PLEO|nr:aspartic peptidase domain-containing protein [Lophiotrema nucula]